ncbi:MAG: hypothetical protein K0B15_14140 [Lentimicrobium sp.]|nr:hypothetical protein [Lentimicrobium sp.]
MNTLTKELIRELQSEQHKVCLSLYMPTHRSHPENLQDPVRYKNLLKQLEESLLQKHTPAEAKAFLEPFEAFGNNTEFWNHTAEGLAILSAEGVFETIKLHGPVEELAMVADSFHTKPLRLYLQSVGHYHVLGLSLHDIRLFEGNCHSLVEIEPVRKSKKNNEESTDDETTEKQTTASSYSASGGKSEDAQFGHRGQNDETDMNTERFFRDIANAVYENYSRPTGWPLVLAALPEHYSLFQKVSKNPMLLSVGIGINPAVVSIDKLKDLAWEIMEPEYLLQLDSLVNRFEQAKANGKGSDDMKEVAIAATEGRVDTLIIEADRMIGVRITNLVTGNTQKKDLLNPRVDDLLDDMGELVTKMGGQVMVFPTDKMPGETGLAAIFRY